LFRSSFHKAAAVTLVPAWNRHDAEAIVGLFFPGAVLMMPTGKMARTRAVFATVLDEWRGKLKATVLSHTVE